MIHLNGIVVLHGDAEIVHPSLKIGADFPAPVVRIFLMKLLSRDAQISPDKNVSFPCTIPSADGTRTCRAYTTGSTRPGIVSVVFDKLVAPAGQPFRYVTKNKGRMRT